MAIEIGQKISHYKILEKLGGGGMGVVYKAEDLKLDRFVALKFLPPSISFDIEAKQRFIHEAKTASALDHPNICAIHEICEKDDGQLFISMAYYEGETLKEKIAKGPIEIDEAMDIILQLSEGLKNAHKTGIIHMDIKPANIFITKDGIVKILDFGLARAKDQTRSINIEAIGGTLNYMSPEQARGGKVDHRTDIWAIGAILYEMITGKQPFKGDYDQVILFLIMSQDPRPISKMRLSVSMELERIVNKALAKYPDKRYQNIDELSEDLRREQNKLNYFRTGFVRAKLIKDKIIALKNWNTYGIIILTAIAAIIAAVFLIIRPFKMEETQSTTSKTSGNSLAVMYFENIPDPEDKDHIGEMLTNLLITSLSQVKELEVISRERLMDIQKQIGTDNSKGLLPHLAGQIAKYAGVSTMVTGSILQEKPSLAITMRLIDVQSGRIINSQQVTNFPVDQIFSLVDSLVYLLRNDFPIIAVSKSEIKNVAQVTTNSLEAYRAYVEGLELLNKFYFKEAEAAFSQAIEFDSSFAMAFYYSGQTQVGQYWKSLQRAVELSERTTERERLQILSYNYLIMDRPDKAEHLLVKLIKEYPYEISAYRDLGKLYQEEFLKPGKTVKVLRAGLMIDPSAEILLNILAYSYAYLNQKQEAIHALGDYIALAPADPNPYDTKGDIYVWFQDYESSRIEYLKAVKLRSDYFSAFKLGCYAVLRRQYNDAQKYFRMCDFKFPVIEIHRGQLKTAIKKFAKLLNSQLSNYNRELASYAMINLYYETGQFSEMLKMANILHNEMKKKPTYVICGRDYLDWALMKNGKSIEAKKMLNTIQKDVSDRSTVLQIYADYSSALLSFEEKKYDLALQKFKKAFSKLPPNHEPNFFYAVTLLKCGQLSEAIKEFNRLLYWPAVAVGNYLLFVLPGSVDYWHIPAVKAHYWLGVAYENQGRYDKAIKEYDKFLDIWKDADFASLELTDAKTRVLKLERITKKLVR